MIKALQSAEHMYSLPQVCKAIATQAEQLNEQFRGGEVVAITLLNGGIVYAGQLLPLLDFNLQLDSISVSRYRDKAEGGQLHWHAYPSCKLEGTTVLLLDDIFDQGITLQQVKAWCLSKGAKAVYSAVLAWKHLDTEASMPDTKPDFYALSVPDKFVVGMGMDYAGKFRNADGIYALNVK